MNIKGLFYRLAEVIRDLTDWADRDARRVTAMMETILDQAETLEQKFKSAKKENAALLKKIDEIKKAQSKAVRDLKKDHAQNETYLYSAHLRKQGNLEERHAKAVAKLTKKYAQLRARDLAEVDSLKWELSQLSQKAKPKAKAFPFGWDTTTESTALYPSDRT